MAQQGKLFSAFEATKEAKDIWVMSKAGRQRAADVLQDLLRRMDGPVTASMMVKHVLRIEGDSIPEHLARVYADQVEAVIEERLQIKAIVEDRGEFNLTIIDASERPMLRGGKPVGFALRESASGLAANRTQVEMGLAAARAGLNRHCLALGVPNEERSTIVNKIPTLEQIVLDRDPAALSSADEAV